MISCYERSLFEQQTPYLQWLKEREEKKGIKSYDLKGKRIVQFPFFSCEEQVEDILKERAIDLQEVDIVLFHGAKGYVDESALHFIGKYFAENEDVEIVYADEDYLGTLQDVYGNKVMESAYALSYRFRDTEYYRGYPWFKPEYSPDTLESFFYFGNIFAVRGKALWTLVEEWRQEEESLSHTVSEMARTLTRRKRYAGHIAEVLFTNEVKMQEKQNETCKSDCMMMENEKGVANVCTKEEIHMLCQQKNKNALISIAIPSKDNSQILKRCLSSLIELTDYPDYEIVIVDNGSSKEEQMCIRQCIAEIEEDYDLKWADDDRARQSLSIQYIYQKSEFNFSAMCNLGARAAKGEYLLFLNDDIEIMHPSWLRMMQEKAALAHVGAVGAKLYFPKAEQEKEMPYRIQHAGITNMGIGPAHKLAGLYDKGDFYHGHNRFVYNMLAVTAACLMVKRERFWEVGGFDEELAVAYNDVDFCFRLFEKGYYNVQRNDVTLLHHESLSRGQDTSPEKAERLEREKIILYKKHPLLCAKDPFYSEHLVQWRKDVEYSCNYQYPFEKKVLPVLLEKETALPKEHRNKYIRKLTGESRMMFQIDQVKGLSDENCILIQGWHVMRGCDNARIEKMLLLKNIEQGDIYQVVLSSKLRYDVETLFAEENGSKRGATTHTALSGVEVKIDKSMLRKGNYQIGIVIQQEKSLMARKICWKKDCLFSVG